MKRLVRLVLVAVITCSTIISAVPGRTSSLYAIVIQMKSEGATLSISSPTNAYVRVTHYIAANTTTSYALENASVYEFQMRTCGKTHISRWTRVGAGVNVTARACEGFSFSQR